MNTYARTPGSLAIRVKTCFPLGARTREQVDGDRGDAADGDRRLPLMQCLFSQHEHPRECLVPVTPDRIVPKQLAFRQYHLIVWEGGVSKEQVLPSDFPDEVPEAASVCERL